jgi:hypothetical protein
MGFAERQYTYGRKKGLDFELGSSGMVNTRIMAGR